MLKVYTKDGSLIVSTNDEAVAACVVSTFGEDGGWVSEDSKSKILWVEGEDGEAAASYDEFSDFIERVRSFLPVTCARNSHWADRYRKYFAGYRDARALAHDSSPA